MRWSCRILAGIHRQSVPPGFTTTILKPVLELYPFNRLTLEPEAREQAYQTKKLLLLHDPWDVLKCREAGNFNVIAPLSSEFSGRQTELVRHLQKHLNALQIVPWSHRNQPERQSNLAKQLSGSGFPVKTFEWDQSFHNVNNGADVQIPDDIGSVCDMSIKQLRWLRTKNII